MSPSYAGKVGENLRWGLYVSRACWACSSSCHAGVREQRLLYQSIYTSYNLMFARCDETVVFLSSRGRGVLLHVQHSCWSPIGYCLLVELWFIVCATITPSSTNNTRTHTPSRFMAHAAWCVSRNNCNEGIRTQCARVSCTRVGSSNSRQTDNRLLEWTNNQAVDADAHALPCLCRLYKCIRLTGENVCEVVAFANRRVLTYFMTQRDLVTFPLFSPNPPRFAYSSWLDIEYALCSLEISVTSGECPTSVFRSVLNWRPKWVVLFLSLSSYLVCVCAYRVHKCDMRNGVIILQVFLPDLSSAFR